ncbi:MAG: Smg family protein [Gammaproteobacteria bacterium]
MFEVLMFLFENYMDGNVQLKTDNETIVLELEKVGFDRFEIDRALDWLDGLNEFQQAVQTRGLSGHAIRHFLPEEVERFGIEGQGLLLYLEQINILDPATREIVIDRIMALDPREVDLGRIRWVVLMALFNQPDKRSALTLLQDMILADAFDVLH